MTIGELLRLFESKQRTILQRQREKAENNYILAQLIAVNLSKAFNSSVEVPNIEEVYPTLFDAKEVEERKANQKNELSVLRFKQFAKTFNKKMEVRQ